MTSSVTPPYGVLAVENGTVQQVNEAAMELLGLSEAAIGRDIVTVFPDSVERTLPSAFSDGDPAHGYEFEQYYPELDQWLSVVIVPDDPVKVYTHDVTARINAERKVEKLRGEVERASLVTDLVSDVLVGLVDASNQTEASTTICEALGQRDGFAFAWLGERKPGGDRLQVRAKAGDVGDTFDAIEKHLAETPERTAIEEQTTEVVQPIPEVKAVPAPVRQAAFAEGIQSVITIPLTYGDTAYGVIGAYTSQINAFSERELSMFETLGTMGGFAINAARNQNLLFADTITECEFEITDVATPLVAVTRETDVTITMEGTVPQNRDRVVCYLSTTGETGVAEMLAGRSETQAVRTVADHEEGRRLEVVFQGGTPLLTVTRLGASIGGATFSEGVGQIKVEVPSDKEVRQVVDALRREFEVDILSKVQRDRSVTTAPQLRDELSDALTERQEAALQTAYLAGYFQSPRNSTAEEVGDALDITGSTLLHHLRASQRKLLDAYFEPDGTTSLTDVESTR